MSTSPHPRLRRALARASAPARSRRRPRALEAALLLAALLLLAILVAAVTMTLRVEYRSEVDEVLNSANRTALKLAGRTTEVLDRIDQTTLLVKHLTERQALPSLGLLDGAGLLSNDLTRVVLLTDRDGFVHASTQADTALNIADEDDFKRHRADPGLGLTIGVPARNPLNGQWAIPASRRINDLHGRFGGIVSVALDPAALSAGYGRSEAHDTAIGVLGRDGVFRSRLVDGRSSFGERMDPERLERSVQAMRTSRQPVRSPIDGVERFVATAPVDRYPFVAVVALKADSALANYRHVRDRVLCWAAVIGGLIVIGAGALLAQARQLDDSRRRIRRAEASFRATLEGSLDAYTILQPVRDESGRLDDLRIAEANSRAAGLVGLTREQLIGWRLTELFPQMRLDGTLRRLERVLRQGRTAQRELPGDHADRPGSWLHHQVVPLEDGGLALITRDVTERKRAERALDDLARRDALTRLSNRHHHDERLAEARGRALRNGGTLALMFIDLDGFKAVNDTLGHAAGDELLVEVGRRLRAVVRDVDTVSRLGGDEFSVIVEDAGPAEAVMELGERIRASLARAHRIDGREMTATPSIGVALFDGSEAADRLELRADEALYRAKRAGKARVWLHGEPAVAAWPHPRAA